MITSASSAERVIEAMAERAYSYFSRPFEPDNVRYMMMQAIAQQEWEDGIEVLSALPEWLSLRLRCCLYTADRLLQFFSELKSDLPAAERAQTAMAFREMLINAIEHGGKLNGEEWVRVSRVRTRRTLIYHIQDPGEGFSRENLAHAAVSNPPEDPLGHIRIRGERGLRAGGFGLLVTKQMVDEVIHNQRGNEVVLVKHLD
jgi:anti-sigma regulatory factor (Ser/Thr protein kinase)